MMSFLEFKQGVRMKTLIEKLEQYRDTQTDFEATLADAVIDVCIDIVEGHSDWISVDERLPDGGVYVLAYESKRGLQHIVMRTKWEYAKDDIFYLWEFSDMDEYLSDEEVTHWQPIPQPPSEVEYEKID